jgi:hypothetical protein
MNGTGFIHDTNPGMGPEVSTVDSGNGFGTRVFWTAVIPDSDVQINPGAGTAQLHVHNLPELDYYSPDGNAALLSLGPTWQTDYFDSTVSFDVVWNRPVTQRVNIRDAADGFAGTFNENQATVTWSTTSTSGFTFTSNPGNFLTSAPEIPGVSGVSAPLNFFAEVGQERNGIFFPLGERERGAATILAGEPTSTAGPGVVGGQPSGDSALAVQPAGASTPASEDSAPASQPPTQAPVGANQTDTSVAHSRMLDQVLADMDAGSPWDAF